MEIATSWRFRASSMLSPLILVGFGSLGYEDGSISTIGIVAMLIGLALAFVALWDVPRSVEFSPDGVRRRCVLRAPVLEWSRIAALERVPTRPLSYDGIQRRLAGLTGHERPQGKGLVARVVPKRRYLLCDVSERPDQWEELRSKLARWAPGVSLPAKPRG